jgi:hypothetical protein
MLYEVRDGSSLLAFVIKTCGKGIQAKEAFVTFTMVKV